MSDAVENAKNAIENDNYEEALKIARRRHSKDDVESYITILDLLIEKIVDSYNSFGGVNLSEINAFPNSETVVTALKDLQALIFPGFKTAENINQHTLRFLTGEKINRVVSILTKETQKALLYLRKSAENSHCFALAEQTVLSLIEEIPELRRKIILDAQAALEGDPAARSFEEIILSFPK